MMGTMGVSLLGAVAGIITDRFGPTVPIITGSVCLLVGYFTIYYSYVYEIRILALLAFGSCFAGFGSTLAYSASIKTAALNFPLARGTAVAFPLAAFGLSAFVFSTLSNAIFKGNTAGFLALLATATSSLCLLNAPFVRPHEVPKSDKTESLMSNPSKLNNQEDANEYYGAIDEGFVSRPFPFRDTSRHFSEATLVPPAGSLLSLNSSYMTCAPSRRESFNIHSKLPGKLDCAVISRQESSLSISTMIQEPAGSLMPNTHDEEHSVTVWEMFKTREFWAQFSVLGLLSGTGQMYIYCCGYIVQALVLAKSTSNGDTELANIQSIQSLQVGLISIFSFVGRLLSGSVSDILTERLRLQRLWMVFIASAVSLLAHVIMISSISNAYHLWMTSCLVGLAYGMTFGVFPTIVCDTFGILHFSKNWGFVAMSPVITVYIFNLVFGTIYDRNSFTSEGDSQLLHIQASVCLKGTACYSEAFQITTLVSLLTLVVLTWMIYTEKHQTKSAIRRASISVNDDR